ncbi:unnamed protein product [Rhizophagus irregularis]|nr:unnamed protein product [Rhizophagus irregularis]CAB5194899.1 unnamed protein product [Rhizophagus irregularis]
MVCRVTQTKRFPRRRENIDRLEKRKAALLGTSVKRSDLRAAMARDLTTYQDYEQRNKITRETGGIRFTIQNFKLDYFSILTPMKLIIAAKVLLRKKQKNSRNAHANEMWISPPI